MMRENQIKSSSLKTNLSIMWNEVVKNVKFLIAYPIVIVFWAIFPIFWFIPFVLQGKAFVGGLQSTSFAEFSGTPDFIPFIVLGAVLNSYVVAAIYGVGESIRREAYQGTLDYLLSSPCNKNFILMGKALSESISSTIYAMVQFLVSTLFFGLEIAYKTILPLLLIIILLMMGAYGVSLMLAAASLSYKTAHDLARTSEYVFYVFSPVRYPLQSLPSWAQIIGRLLPLTYALIAVRGLVLLKQNISAFYQEVLLLFFVDIVAIVGGSYFFDWMERRTKKSGAISHF